MTCIYVVGQEKQWGFRKERYVGVADNAKLYDQNLEGLGLSVVLVLQPEN